MMLQIFSLCLLTLISHAVTYEKDYSTEIIPDNRNLNEDVMINDDYRPVKSNYHPGVKNKPPIKTNNLINCKTPPAAPIFGDIKCSKVRCRAQCHANYQFPNGEHQLSITCHNGEWQIDGTEWTTLPHCEPICLSQCQNNGICINPNECECPENFSGPQCQYEIKPCLNFPPPVQNSRRHCNTNMCTVTCAKGFVFPDGSAIAISHCRNGNWVPSRSHWVTIPDCQPICSPPCENGGVCLPLNVCQCPQTFRGPQCQYSQDECNVQKLAFNGGYNCNGDANSFSCTLNCPPGVDFTSAPALQYICTYDKGIFLPQPIPQCKTGSDYQIVPIESSQNSYIKITNHSWIIQGTSISKLSSVNQSQNDISSEKKMDVKSIRNFDSTDEQSNINDIPNVYYENFNEASMIVKQNTPKPKTCFTWGGIHYKTFDGAIYSFNSVCSYTLLQEIQDGTFTITSQNSFGCKNNSGLCYKILKFYIQGKEYLLKLNDDGYPIIKMGKKILPIPGQFPGLRIQMAAHFIVVSLDSIGAMVKWDGRHFVQIKALESLWNKTAGLCGRMNGNIKDDKTIHDHSEPKSIATFLSDWKVNNFDETCEELSINDVNSCDPTTDLSQQAMIFCSQLFADKRFDACLTVVDLSMLKNTCQLDYCNCKENDKRKCACNTMNIYVRQCYHDRIINSIAWQHTDDICPMICTGGKIYKACAPKSQATCSGDMKINSLEDFECEEGCVCPDETVLHEGKCISIDECPCTLRGKLFKPGAKIPKQCNSCTCSSGKWICTEILCTARCAAIGDPHYVTFDGKRYDFMGKCNYYMIKGDNYSVETENVACSGAISEVMGLSSLSTDAPSCTKSVTIRAGNTTIKLKQHHQVLINGEEIKTLPFEILNTKIRIASSIFIIINMENGLEIWWDGISRIYINAPPKFHDKTKGLCGTFTANQKDDFLTPMGDIEQSVIPFANKWKTSEQCNDIPVKQFKHTCEINPERYETSKNYCSKIWSETFSNCHWHVDPQSFYDDCMYDMCACETNIEYCLCPTFAAYAKECAAVDIKILWRLDIDICQLHCPNNQQYQICGNSCTRSCSDITFNKNCRQECVEGCNCPDGQTLDVNGECIPIGQCPCEYNGMEFSAGHREIRPGIKSQELCTCAGGLWLCSPATPFEIREYPAAINLKTICTNAKHLEVTNCEPIVPKTCRNMHEIINQTPAICRSGCVCQRGYVLDTPSGECVEYHKCPCYHGGKSYPENSIIQENCNTCKCNNGKWNCTNIICPGICSAWGDSHFNTFDDKSFDFQGICDYILAKGTFGNDDSFDITMQNVPCGSIGVTCSKSISLTVGKDENQETVTLTRGKSLPINKFKRIAIRKVGLFIFLDVPDLGIVVQWDKGTRIYIKLHPKWKGHTKGLCGDYNDNSEDDFKSPSGGIAEVSSKLFANSWKINSYCPESNDTIDTCVIHPERKIWATEKCGILKSKLFELCHSEVDIVPFIQRCIFDTCGCDSGGDCECLCTSLAAYAHECNIHGIPIRWRSQELCPIQCDETCSNYSPCMSTCPQETCDNIPILHDDKHLCNQDACIEGCLSKSCPTGYVYANSSFKECVLRTECKPKCLEINGIIYNEGDKVSSDECQTCYCSRSKIICNGAPCITTTIEPTTVPMEESERCIDGWSEWFNRKSPKLNGNDVDKSFIDIEPLPTMLELLSVINSSRCDKNHMIDIRCRTVKGHKTPKETLNDADCNLERGLYCDNRNNGIYSMPCDDFEISILCRCFIHDSSTVSTSNVEGTTRVSIEHDNCDVNHQYQAHPNNCHEFYQCAPSINGTKLVKKTCGVDMMYNPTLRICDWPNNVLVIRPECNVLMDSSTTVATERCKIGEHWDECAIKCQQTCQYYRYTLNKYNICISDSDCVAGCVPNDKIITCPLNKYWRDQYSCVEMSDCPCKSHNGEFVKPGDVIEESKCERCQCLSNYYTCDKSLCDLTTEKVRLTTENVVTDSKSLVSHAIIIHSTVSPAVPCASGQFTSLLGNYNAGEVMFDASSSAGDEFAPKMAHLLPFNGVKSTGNYWKPQYMDTEQWIDVKLPHLSPVYGVVIQGTSIGDEYVTSYRVLFSQNGDETFSYVLENYKPKIFHGPIDSSSPVRQFFEQPIEARVIRINPQTWHHEIAVRVDLIGCEDHFSNYEISTTTIAPLLTTVHDIWNKKPICDDPMGLDSGIMVEEQVVASSTLDNLIPNLKLSSPGIWRPKFDNPNQYVEFDFLENRNITGIESKGGDDIWTKAYKVFYGENKRNWNQMLDSDGEEKIFLGNFDDKTVKINYFDEPVSARFLKIQPIKWHNHVGLKAEIRGCFIPYPENQISPIGIKENKSLCNVCHEIFQSSDEKKCHCDEKSWWNGEKCVEKQQCPCVVDQISYAVGTTFETGDCQKCLCAMGGAAVCQFKICDPCNDPNTRSVVTELCGCVCKPCPSNMKLCRTSNICINESLWCNNIKDCPDDETNCEVKSTAPTTNNADVTSHTVIEITTTETKNVTKIQCETPVCPKGYKLKLLKKSSLTKMSHHSSSFTATKGVVKGGKRGYGKKWQRIPKQSRINDHQNVELKPNEFECEQFSCAPIKPPPPIFDDEVKPIECPEVQCPPNYRVVYEPMSIYKPVRCPQYICKPPEPIQAVCNVTERTFNTFDGMEYKYDICNHILAREMWQNKWYITLEKHCEILHQPCTQVLAITMDNDVIILHPDMHVTINEYEFTPKQVNRLSDRHGTFRISKIGNIIHFISNKYGFWIIWDENSNVKIGITTQLMHQIDGLCGYFDGNINNDRQKPDGNQAITSEDFGNSWTMDGTPECKQQTCPRHIIEQAHEICDNINDRSFTACSNVIDKQKYLSRCLETTCMCINGNITKENCRCRALNSFATDCQAANPNIDLSTWRGILNCPMNCPAPFIYKDCFRNKCEMTCDNLQEIDPCPKMAGVCFSGCFCPDGTIRNGDNCIPASECRDCACNGFGNSNFINYDKKNFTFTGNCTYVLSRDVRSGTKMQNGVQNGVENGNTYQIFMTNVPCERGICTEAISVIYKEHFLHIEQNKKSKQFLLALDGEAIDKLPYKISWIIIENNLDNDLTILIPAIQLQIITYHHNFAFTIRLPSNIFGGAMEGLCGNCNANDEDDFKRLNGKLTDDIDEFGMSWLATGLPEARFLNTGDCAVNKEVKHCQPPLSEANNSCLIILNTDLFGQCHNLVDPMPFLYSCYDTLCKNGDPCGDIEAYARNCRQFGLCPKWRDDNLCPYKCPQDLIYQSCGPSCPDNCDTLNTIDKQKCYQDYVEGCFCPENQVYHNNSCIPKTKCFICDDSGHVDGDIWQPDKCTTCSCNNKVVNCQMTQCPMLETICQENFTPILSPGSENECCMKYLCIPMPTSPTICDEPQQLDCGYGQIMKLTIGPDGCQKFICQCLPSEECPIIIEPITSEVDNNLLPNGYSKVLNTSGCCPRLINVCKPETCPKPPPCPKYHNLKINNETPDNCCNSYECILPKDICLYTFINDNDINNNINNNNQIIAMNIDDKWQDGACTNCTCEELTDGNAKVNCITTECLKLNHHLDNDEFVLEEKIIINQCCPLIERVACKDQNGGRYEINETWHSNNNDTCEMIKCINETNGIQKKIIKQECNDFCERGYEYVESKDKTINCCGDCIAVACIVNGSYKAIGEKWRSDDYCINYECLSKNGTLFVAETIEVCNKSCELGWEYEETIDNEQCCGRCKQIFCNVNGELHKSGSIWYSNDNCTVYECKNVDEQLIISTSSHLCPDISDCPPADIYNDGCCLKCNLSTLNIRKNCMAEVIELDTTIGILREKRSSHGICRNLESIDGLTECHGNCHSSTHFNPISWVQETDCQCCQPVEMKSIVVNLTCEDGKVFMKRIFVPISCSCDACKGTKRPIKGHKSPIKG